MPIIYSVLPTISIGHRLGNKNSDSQTELEKVYTQLTLRLDRVEHLAKIGHWELNLKTNSLFWSKAIYEIFEIDPSQFEASYDAFLSLIHPDDRQQVDTAYANSIKNKTAYGIVHRLRMPDGRIKVVEEQCETDFDEHGAPLLSRGTVQDITEKTELQKKEKEIQEKLFQTARLASIGELAAGVGHEINNPLMIILQTSEALQQHLQNQSHLDETSQKYLQINLNSIKRIENIVRSLRMYAPAESEQFAPTSIEEAINNSLDLVQSIYKKNGIHLQLELNVSNCFINGSLGKLEQVFVNLLNNAKDALENRDNKKIIISAKNIDGKVLVQVQDNGVGISSENMKRVFDSFFTTKDRHKGTGLGMNIVYNLVKQMYGNIQIKSQLDVGTTVSIEFPLVAKPELAINITPKPTTNDNANIAAKRILVVDDEEPIAELLQSFLEKMGHHVDIAFNANTAKQKIAEQTYDLVMSDNTMPGGTGLQLFSETVAQHTGFKILMTGQMDLAKQDINVDHILLKPFDLMKLKETLRSLFKTTT